MNRAIIALFALIAVASAYPAEEKKLVRILDQKIAEPDPEGSYSYSYETENGIKAEEAGISDPEEDLKVVSGSYTYTAPDGTPIHLDYIANGDGFLAEGDHLPVAPPVPELIQKALEYIAAHPKEDEDSS